MKTLIINYKSDTRAFDNGMRIAELCGRIPRDRVNIMLAPPATMLRQVARVAKAVAQHTDSPATGGQTGKITVEEVSMSGASGSILNHSENRMTLNGIASTVETLRKNGLISIVCADNLVAAKQVGKRCMPDYMALEPSDLIGGSVSVSIARRQEVREFVAIAREAGSVPLVGAGIRTENDVMRANELGAEGILVSSAVMHADNFRAAITGLTKALVKKIAF
ncbi:MAG: triose-phosphate isomerase [Candidatus Micrarchaeota archaeon]|nr:triose-phosphate isomerase [Candidatus Micrarchaeota archaeon]